MGRPRSLVPAYRLHKQSCQAVVTLTDFAGNRRDKLLGQYGSKESRVEYARIIAEWEAAGRSLAPPARASDLTVNELLVLFLAHAEKHYRHPDGRPTSELYDYKKTLAPFKRLYGHTIASDFGPLALKAIRQAMIDGSWLTEAEKAKRLQRGHKNEWTRRVLNQRIGRIKRLFKWAVENELVPVTTFQALQTIRGLQKGRCEARETQPIKPVVEEGVAAVLPLVSPPLAAVIRLQQCTGMRPGEACILRGIDLEMSGPVWLYRPGSDQGPEGQHKTAYRGQQRIIPIGPKGQEILRPWLRLNLQDYLFQPREAMAALRAVRRQNRKTKVQPSQRHRRKRKPRKQPGDHYSVMAYAKAIGKACIKAGVPHWHPNQLRHAFATEVRRRYGLETAQVLLGHSRADVTQVYAERNQTLAEQSAAEIG